MKAISEVIHQRTAINKASKALILLHGRGATAKNIIGLMDRLCDETYYVAAPQAVNNTWYPHSFMAEESLNEPYLSSSVESIKELIDQIAVHIPKNKIYIAGFSQGACLSLEISARFAEKYGGIVAFTGGLIGKTIDMTKYKGNFEGTKVFISNGDHDPHIPLTRSYESKAVMEKLHAHVTLKVYPGRPHTVNEEEIKLVREGIFQ